MLICPNGGILSFVSKRPKINERKFVSAAVDAKIDEIKKDIKNPKLANIFENCFPNTLDTTVYHSIVDDKPDTYIITGDIDAMWLRDSTAQVWPYLELISEDEQLKCMIEGVIRRQAKYINIDPYANAFNFGPTGSEWEKDLTEMKPELHERKWEIDSLCYAVRLAYNFWKITNETHFFDESWMKAAKNIYDVFIDQQRKEDRGNYKFQRNTCWHEDTVADCGLGRPIKPNGLICSTFRPSDDATVYPFLIPSNYFAVVSLRQMSEIISEVYNDDEFSKSCLELAHEIENALNKFAIVDHVKFKKIIPYEIDGFGNHLFMDDANVPSLLSLPYLGAIDRNSELYEKTRNFLLSDYNPYFFKGEKAEGNGSPHTGLNMIWHMSIIMRALTSVDEDEIRKCLKMILRTDGETGFLHESFHKDDDENFTREWFAWTNTLFGELIVKIYNNNRKLLKEDFE